MKNLWNRVKNWWNWENWKNDEKWCLRAAMVCFIGMILTGLTVHFFESVPLSIAMTFFEFGCAATGFLAFSFRFDRWVIPLIMEKIRKKEWWLGRKGQLYAIVVASVFIVSGFLPDLQAWIDTGLNVVGFAFLIWAIISMFKEPKKLS